MRSFLEGKGFDQQAIRAASKRFPHWDFYLS
jgi:hypothetical protein